MILPKLIITLDFAIRMPKLKKITSYWFLLDCFFYWSEKSAKIDSTIYEKWCISYWWSHWEITYIRFVIFRFVKRYQILMHNFSLVSLSFVCLFISHNKDFVVNSITYDYVLLAKFHFHRGFFAECLCALFFSSLMHSSLWVYV